MSFNLTSSSSTYTGSGNSSVTVTTNDVNGYSLYIYGTPNPNLTKDSSTIAASSNTSEGSLATNTWGYNAGNSGNYIGLTTSLVLLTSKTSPYESGNTTNV